MFTKAKIKCVNMDKNMDENQAKNYRKPMPLITPKNESKIECYFCGFLALKKLKFKDQKTDLINTYNLCKYHHKRLKRTIIKDNNIIII